VENLRKHQEIKSIAVYGIAAWGTALYIAFSRFATLESGLASAFVAGFRFLLGMPLVYLAGWWVTGRRDFYKSKNRGVQIKRSVMLFFVTVLLIAGTKALRNVALTNAYTFTVFAIVALRTRLVHGKPLHPLGWVSVGLCVAGVVSLVIASGSAGAHPYLGLALVLASMYCHVMMMEYATVLGTSGDSAFCSLFWSGVVGFAVAALLALYCAADVQASRALVSEMRLVDTLALCMLLGVTVMALAPQGGYSYAGLGADPLTLAPAGLTQIVPAVGIQMFLDGGTLPNGHAVAGIATLLVSAICSIQGQKRLAAAAAKR
jgi:drug/metabolite transporter (DMT)-like permease